MRPRSPRGACNPRSPRVPHAALSAVSAPRYPRTRTPARLARWQTASAHGRLGWDLWVRNRLLGMVYGAGRPRLERALAGNDGLLTAGCRHWAALPQPALPLAGAGARAAWRFATGAE